jgi:hypothetical protein
LAKKSRLIQSFVVVAIIAFVVIAVSGDEVLRGNSLSLTDWGGYLTGYEGPKPYFYGVSYQDEHYTAWSYHDASYHRFDSYFKFDVDGYSSGKVNIMGEETSIFVPEKSAHNTREWLPYGWNNDLQYVQNPIGATYQWEVGDKIFSMEQWLMRYYVTFNAEWDGNEHLINEILLGEDVYQDVEVWIRIDLKPIQYFSGMEKCYFAIAEVELAHDVELRVKYDGSDDYSSDSIRNGLSVHPESGSSNVMIYYQPWGQGGSAGKTVYDYKGFELSPDLFCEEVYMHVDLNNFGVLSYKDYGIWEHIKADSATWAFDVIVFVIGEWKVQDIDEPPELYGRFTQGYSSLEELLSGLGEFFTSPYGLFFLLIIIAVVLLIFAPQVLFGLAGSLGGKKSKGMNTLLIVIVVIVFLIFILPWLLRMLGVG